MKYNLDFYRIADKEVLVVGIIAVVISITINILYSRKKKVDIEIKKSKNFVIDE